MKKTLVIAGILISILASVFFMNEAKTVNNVKAAKTMQVIVPKSPERKTSSLNRTLTKKVTKTIAGDAVLEGVAIIVGGVVAGPFEIGALLISNLF